VDRKKTKQVILKIMKKQESCFKDLIVKINEQRKKIKEKDEALVLEIIEEKNILIEIYKNLEEEMESHLQLLSQLEIQDLLVEGVALKTNLEELLKKIIHMEEECEEEISLKMKEVEKRIFGLQKGKKIGKGYGEFFKNRPLISRKV
jgi:hypothetical protein